MGTKNRLINLYMDPNWYHQSGTYSRILPNNYSLTDKADGDRCIGIVINKNLYLIFSNLDIKKSGIKLDSDKFNNSIVDGEYIFNKKYNKYIFALFDILYYNGDNIQNEINLETRYKKLNDIVRNGFKFDYEFKKYNDKFDLEKIEEYYKDDLKRYLKYLIDNLSKVSLIHLYVRSILYLVQVDQIVRYLDILI